MLLSSTDVDDRTETVPFKSPLARFWFLFNVFPFGESFIATSSMKVNRNMNYSSFSETVLWFLGYQSSSLPLFVTKQIVLISSAPFMLIYDLIVILELLIPI